MDARNTVRTLERDTIAMFAPWNEMMNQSRVYFEKSLSAMRGETMELLTKLHDRNGEILEQCANRTDLAALASAQEKWFADFSRDMLAASRRLQETTRHILAESIESVGQSMRNGAQAAADAGAHAAEAVQADAKDAEDEAEDAWHGNGAEPSHPEHNA
ncbi:MAG: hypothetical protein WDM86_20155 [Rhizomicrobium sp.]